MKLYTHVANVGSIAILAQYIGEEPDGTLIPSFFPALMITEQGRPAHRLEDASDLVRVGNNRDSMAQLIEYCHGYNVAASERGGVKQGDWKFPNGSILPERIETPTDEERQRLKNWPTSVETFSH